MKSDFKNRKITAIKTVDVQTKKAEKLILLPFCVCTMNIQLIISKEEFMEI